MVLMATHIDDPRVHPLGLIGMKVNRNAFGRQRESFEADIPIKGLDGDPFHAVFIRAPVVTKVDSNVTVLARSGSGDCCRRKRKTYGPCLPPGTRWRYTTARTVFTKVWDLIRHSCGG